MAARCGRFPASLDLKGELQKKRQRTGAIQDLADFSRPGMIAKRLGVRESLPLFRTALNIKRNAVYFTLHSGITKQKASYRISLQASSGRGWPGNSGVATGVNLTFTRMDARPWVRSRGR